MLTARLWLTAAASVALVACHRLSPMEQKIVGAWSWTYIEGQGRMVFTADHKLKEGFPPDEEKGRPLRDDDFDYLRSGTWHLEGDVLVTETDNTPYIAWFDRSFPKDTSEKRPKLEREVKRQKITHIDGEKMVFSDGYSLQRDTRVK
jgi:hypothetical protein